MKQLKIIIAALLIFVLPFSAAMADRSAGISVAGFGSFGMPLSPEFVTEFYNSGMGFGGEFRLNLSGMSSLAVSYTHQSFGENEELKEMIGGLFINNIDIEGMELSVDVISANYIQYFSPRDASLAVYMALGAAYYVGSVSDLKVDGVTFIEGDETELGDDVGMNVGLGFEFPVGDKLGLFLEGNYHYIFQEAEKIDEIDLDGGSFTFFTVKAGARISL